MDMQSVKETAMYSTILNRVLSNEHSRIWLLNVKKTCGLLDMHNASEILSSKTKI